MFNLIVGGEFSSKENTFMRSRVFENTESHLIEQFQPSGELDINSVVQLPTLIMREGRGNELARVGMLSRLRRGPKDYQFNIDFEEAVPPITNAKIFEIRDRLDMNEWSFSRTYWAIKDIDLYHVLYTADVRNLMKPAVFKLSDDPVNPDIVSVMMPFDANFDDVYASLNSAAQCIGKTCVRADDIWENDAIIQDVVDLIRTAGVVICDLSGKRANVFYEAGIAHTLGKNVILITQSPDDVPFDLRHLRYIHYYNNGEGRSTLAEQVRRRLETIEARS